MPETPHGSSNIDVNNAVDRLVKVLSFPCQDELARYLEGASEKKQMVGIVLFLLLYLCTNIVLNKQDYSAQFLACENATDISGGWLEIGTRLMWRESPDCRCNVDIVSVDEVVEDASSVESDCDTDTSCSSSGIKVVVEGKKVKFK